MKPTKRMDLPRRFMDLMVLRAVALEPQYGWALSRRIHEVSGKTLLIQQGSMYPSLHRLVDRGWIKAKSVKVNKKYRVKLYEATRKGRKRLREGKLQEDSWSQLAADIAQVLATAQ